MKKVLALITGLIITAALVGCTGQDTTLTVVDEADDTTAVIETETDVETDTDTKITRKDATEVVPLDEKSTLDQILDKEDPKIEDCNGLKEELLKNVCIRNIVFDLVRDNNDTSYCSKLNVAADKEKCKDLVK